MSSYFENMAAPNLKEELQRWLLSNRWHLHITVQIEGFKLEDQEVEQRLRQVCFDVNRTFLPSRFKKYDASDVFWGIGVFEHEMRGGTRHCHTMWHVPFGKIKYAKHGDAETKSKFWVAQICNQIQTSWRMLASLNPTSFRQRTLKPLHIQSLHSQPDSNSVAIYDSKKLGDSNQYTDWFVIGEPKRLASAKSRTL